MIGKKINELATELDPINTDLTIIGDPITGVSKKITLAQISSLFGGAIIFVNNYASLPATGTIDIIYCLRDSYKIYIWNGGSYVETLQILSQKGSANGYASLDSSGKVPISQLPSSIMEYKGMWNASTNTPTLANGTGDTGDVYICNVAGNVNFGAGVISFAVGDYVIYSGSIWQRSSGATGTVTSVALSVPSGLSVSGSPIATSGTITITGAGNSTQYLDGTGALQTFPTLLSSDNLVKLVRNQSGATMAAGTIIYISGATGNKPLISKALATSDATSAQTYGLLQSSIANNADGYVVVIGNVSNLDTSALTEGQQLYLSGTTAGTYTTTKPYAPIHLVYVGIVLRSHPTQGIIGVKIQNGYEMDELHNVDAYLPNNNDILSYNTTTSLWEHKQIATTLGYTPANINGIGFVKASGTTISYDNSTFVDIVSNQSIAGTKNFSNVSIFQVGIKVWNGNYVELYDDTNTYSVLLRPTTLTATRIINFPNKAGTIALTSDLTGGTVTSVGMTMPLGLSVTGSPITTSGTLALSFTSGYSIPTTASQTTWDTAYSNRITSLTTTGTSGAATLIANVLNIPQYQAAGTYVTSVTGTSPIVSSGGTTPAISIPVATTSVNGYLSSADWTTFNNKQAALTNPVTGTGTTNYLPKFTGSSTIGNSAITDDGTTVTLVSRALSGTSASFSDIVKIGSSYSYSWASGYSISQLGYGTAIWTSTSSNSNLYLSSNLYYNAGFKIAADATLKPSYLQLYNGALTFSNAASGAINSTFTPIDLFTIASTGAATFSAGVGINGATLQTGLGAGLTIEGSVYSTLYFSNSSTLRGYLTAYSGGLILNSVSSNLILNNGGSPVLIGTTTVSGAAILQVTGAATFSSSVTATQGNFSLGTVGGAIGSVKNLTVSNSNGAVGDWSGLNFAYYNNTTNFAYIGSVLTSDAGNSKSDLVFGVKASTSVTAVTEYMRIQAGGNVGIGTTSALQTLTLAGTQMMYNTGGDGVANTVIGSITSQVRNYGTGIATSSFASIQFATDPTTWYKGDIRFLTNGSDGTSTGGTERMRITSGGNVLIGTTTDAGYKLDVNGTGRFTSNLLAQKVQVGTAATINDATGVGNTLQFANYSAGVFVTGSADSYIYKTSGVFGGLSAQTLIFQTRSDVAGGGFAFVAGSTPSAVATISNAGAATFSSTLGINGVADNIKSGTYTPTIASVYNVASSSANPCQYMRVGNVVTVSGSVSVTATATNTWTRLSITLPISSNFDYSYRAGGGGGANATNNVCVILAGASTSVVYLDAYPNSTSGLSYFFSFTYSII